MNDYVEDYEAEHLDSPHNIIHVRFSEDEQWCEFTCKCGWNVMRGSITEAVEKYVEHLEDDNGNDAHAGSDRLGSAEPTEVESADAGDAGR